MSQHRYPPRDRSPPRQFDRRSSNTYTPNTTSSSYRPNNDSSQTPLDRPPPRGPRADSFRGGFNATPRGRGAPFASRGGDSWDRDRDRDRDTRNPPNSFRRDDDRAEWQRRDERPQNFNRERSYVGRERSASPIRSRRDSKEAIATPFNRGQDSGSSYFPASSRGGADRGRGRGGWDRSRDRNSFVSDRERDLFPNRSRSREGWREREFDRPRPFANDVDRNDRFDRREFDRPPERELRGREHDVWQRDASPGRSSTGNRAPSPGALSSISQDRKFDYETSRKTIAPSNLQPRETRRDTDSDYFNSRPEPPRREPTFSQPPPVPAVPQSAAFGLDYGPPPSTPAAAPTPVTSSTEKLLNPAKPMRNEPQPPPAGNNAFQPPSGPKAERSLPSHTTNQQPQQMSASVEASRSKPESNIRARPQQPETTSNHVTDFSKSTNDQINERANTMTSASDRPLPQHVPSGPRSSISGAPYKPRTSPIAPQMTLPPAQAKSSSIDSRALGNAPTGPRSASILPPSGPRGSLPSGPASTHPGPASASWRRPQIEYRPPKPSIMGNMNRLHMTDRVMPQSTHMMPNRYSPKQTFKQLPETEKSIGLAKPSISQPLISQEHSKDADTPGDVEVSATVSEDEDPDDEPESELDENYFADQEKSHAREMAILKSRMPPPLLEDQNVVRLLIRIQLLGMIAEGLVPEGIQSVKDEKDVEMADKIATDMPSPQRTSEESQSPPIEHPKPRGRPLKEPPVNPIPTPPMEDLPYLLKRSEEPSGQVVFDEFSDSDDIQDEQMNTILKTQFESQVWEEKDNLVELSDFYKVKFPEWKYEIEQQDRIRILEATPDPGSPGAQSAVSIPPSAERLTSRAARNATEFDLEKVLALSEQSAREDAERREREASSNAKPNYDTEAVVPDMLRPADRDLAWRFEDRNYLVPTEYAVDLMQYMPPEDDFSKDEQAKFIDAFCRTPKKWGLIADQIPGRSYQECIAHYYLTKNETRYKEIWRRSQPKRKRGRAATKPRSTALLSDMALNEDPDATPAPVTDSGRPRRAAAPTFGDGPEGESAALPAAKRVAVGPKDSVETPAPKTKGRKAGTATKVRRTKAQIAADAQALAAQVGGDPTTLARSTSGRVRPIVRAENIAVKADVVAPATVIEAQPIQPLPIAMPVSQVRPDQLNPPVVTSYWSVPEQQKFRQLIAYYGRDFTKIADFMKTKSQAMIKNHFARESSKGDPELERAAIQAEERVARGEALGRLPSPIAPPKRKYDPIPVMTSSGRPLTAEGQASLDAERVGFAVKSSVVEDFPANTIHRDANGSIVAKPSPRDEFLPMSSIHSVVQPKHEDLFRDRPIAQKPSGPPRGHFTDDVFMQNLSRQQHGNAERTPHHHPPHVTTLEEPHSVLGRELLGQGRDTHFLNQSASQTQRYRNLEADRPSLQIRHGHSRNPSHTGGVSSVSEQQGLEHLALQSERSRLFGSGVNQSPRVQPIQTSVPSRPEHYGSFVQQQQQQAQPPPIKQEPAKPAKRSNILDMLNDDPPPERPAKRSSTDSAHRTLIQTPPPQTLAPQSQPLYMQRGVNDPIAPRPMAYSQGPSSLSETRNAYSSSPAPSHRSDWLDKFDPRQSNGQQPSNQSPLYAGMPPAPSGAKPLLQDLGDRSLDMNASRRSNLGRGPIASPPIQASTPTQQYRPSSTNPQHSHSRISSLGFPQTTQPNHEHRQQAHQLQQVTLPPSTQGTPISAHHSHSRAQPSTDYNSRRLTIQQYKAENPLDQTPIDQQHRGPGQIVPPPTQQQQPQDPRDSRDPYSRDVPPPPRSVFNYPGPSRSYTNTPPLQSYTPQADPRIAAHNQHAHQSHHGISGQQQQQQQQQTGHHHHLPHHQLVPQPQSQQQQQQHYREQQQQRYSGQQIPQQSHYRNYSQGPGDDRGGR